MRRLGLLAAFLLAACSGTPSHTAGVQSPTAAASSQPGSPSPGGLPSPGQVSPSAQSAPASTPPVVRAWGVFLDGPPASVNGYSVLLVGTDGKVAASAQAVEPAVYRFTSPPPAPPLVSITNSRVYYADGTSVKFLKPDGSTGIAMSYPGGPQTVAGFSVSPDDRRVAVALLTFQTPSTPQALDLYVEDLGGGNRVDLFKSATVTEWPVAWTNGHVVVAVGPLTVGGTSKNPYNGTFGYHVADATSGNRLVTMSDDCLYGPLVPAGSACVMSGQIYGQFFDGSIRTIFPSNQDGPQYHLVLTPDGAGAAGQLGSASIVFFYPAQGDRNLGTNGAPMGWIDNSHLVFAKPNSSGRGILDLNGGSIPPEIPMPACTCANSGIFFGSIPLAS